MKEIEKNGLAFHLGILLGTISRLEEKMNEAGKAVNDLKECIEEMGINIGLDKAKKEKEDGLNRKT